MPRQHGNHRYDSPPRSNEFHVNDRKEYCPKCGEDSIHEIFMNKYSGEESKKCEICGYTESV